MYSDQVDTFNSIDDLLEFYLTKNVINLERVNVYEYLMHHQPTEVLIALTTGTNTPSIHDLNLISCVTKPKQGFHSKPDEWLEVVNRILKIYRDRKE